MLEPYSFTAEKRKWLEGIVEDKVQELIQQEVNISSFIFVFSSSADRFYSTTTSYAPHRSKTQPKPSQNHTTYLPRSFHLSPPY